ncbi:u3 small nucleolar ribonucleoprotein mpp10 [Holotrichia oblita]|uniref:U3 small nucleolar ribonucleoprotein mpp10 n=1 Tax=Holotrichia oblita TaxID=644536 RepID=A0ACB9TQH2_HOLOL|nr:u3 small nucleolar ribonucleoprotein mpp10 [Holotrichia oblita]
MANKLEELLNKFNNITEKPESFLSTVADHNNTIRFLVKNAYDFTKLEEENTRKSQALSELIIENFDLEQIWQQLELQNEDLLNKSLIRVSKFAVNKNRLIFEELDKDLPPDKEEEDEIKEKLDSETDDSESETSNDENNKFDDNQEDGADEDDKSSINEEGGDNEGIKLRKSIVDDDFFKLDEMEKFLKSEEKDLNKKSDDDSGNESKDEDEEIDYFKGDDDDEQEDDEANLQEKNPRYKDFFSSNETEKPTKRNKFLEENADDDEPIQNEPKSQDIVLSEKPWQLQGEITAENRPQNSLLEEIVEFDLTSRPAPVITEKTTFQLEDVIRQRIKDKAFDSVERKEKPVETPLEYKKKLVLDQEKSKQSLAQIYEKEYLQQVETVAGDVEEKDEEPESHKEIKKMMQILFRQLDALSNYHFTPKPAAPELRIVNNLPAINMEEVAPIAATDASLLAPEEVKGRIKGDIIGKNERSDADKNRERRKKKRKQKIHANERIKRENTINKFNPGLGNKYSKEKARKELEKVVKDKNVDKMDESIGTKHIKSSSAFFKQLEEEVKSHIKVKTTVKRKQNPNELNAKKLKL